MPARLSPSLLSRAGGPLRLVAVIALLAGLLVLGPRLSIEWQWFGEFGLQAVVLRRWLLQLLAFVLVMGLGVPLQLQQLQRCWRLRGEAGYAWARQADLQ